MAMKFLPGMTNVLEVLNQMWDAFAAGPYNSLPLTGGNLIGPVNSSSTIAAVRVAAGDEFSGSAIAAPNGGVGGMPGVWYDAVAIGAISVPGYSNGARFIWSTRTAPGDRGAGCDLRLRVAYTGAPVSDPLLTVNGYGDFTAGRSVIGNDFFPKIDDSYTVGTPAFRFQSVYATTGTINTSDARLKCDFRDLTAAEIAAARDIARAIGIYRWRDAVDGKGSGAREHIGPTVQRAIEIMQSHDLDPFGYGFICYDEWEQQTVEHPAVEARPAVAAVDAAPAVLDSLGNIVTEAVAASPAQPATEARAAYTEVTLEAGDRYAFRYDELAMFMVAGQEAATAALEARLAALEAAP